MGTANTNRSIRLDADKCVRARTRKGLSRERLATASRGGISLATVKRLEKGAPVYLDTARCFAELLSVPLTELVSDSELPSAAPELSQRPAMVVVLPFDVLGPDDEISRYFADGLVEDLITRLGRRWFPVISRSSSFSYGVVRPDATRLRADLGADYAIEGSVRRSGGTLRITARLVDTRTLCQVWANSYDRPYADIFKLQDQLVAAIVAQIDVVLVEQQYLERRDRDPSDLSAWEIALRGSWNFHRRTKQANGEARLLFEEALRREPMLPLAWYSLAMTHQRDIVNQWSSDPGGSVREMAGVCVEFARRHPEDPGLHVATAYAAVYAGERASATNRLRTAIELDPNAPVAYSLYGQLLAMKNEPDDAIEQFEQSMRLSPRDSDLWSVQTALALCHFVAQRYDEMLAWAQEASRSRPDIPFPFGTMGVALAYLDRVDEARLAIARMVELEPRSSVRGLRAIVASTNPDIVERYVEGLRRAGTPD